MTIVVIGKTGQVGRALQRVAAAQRLPLVALDRAGFDLARPEPARIAGLGPSVIINAGAYTAVDKAESEPAQAFAVNVAGAEAAARVAADVGAAFIHFSTDYVYGGDKAGPYVETDPTSPTGVYGATKLEGEARVRRAAPRSVILRTAWVYDAQGSNFVRTMLRLAKQRPNINVVDDQYGNPTYAVDIAGAALALAVALSRGNDSYGVFHCVGAGETTWAKLARAIFAESRARGGPSAEVTPIKTSEYPTDAKRPANSRLDCSKLARDYDLRLRPWPEALADCVEEIASAGWSVK